MLPEFEWWRLALAGRAPDPVMGEPQCGYYKATYSKAEQARAVAIWLHDGRIVARVNMTFYDPDEVWERCCRTPVSYEDYTAFMSTGTWKDHPATPDGQLTRDLSKAAPIY